MKKPAAVVREAVDVESCDARSGGKRSGIMISVNAVKQKHVLKAATLENRKPAHTTRTTGITGKSKHCIFNSLPTDPREHQLTGQNPLLQS